ncbi:MAG: hypothetical protein HZB76_00275 [Chlamydiae bacterium]|nr:hypothetical protein [Chlamydiota bacterium]
MSALTAIHYYKSGQNPKLLEREKQNALSKIFERAAKEIGCQATDLEAHRDLFYQAKKGVVEFNKNEALKKCHQEIWRLIDGIHRTSHPQARSEDEETSPAKVDLPSKSAHTRKLSVSSQDIKRDSVSPQDDRRDPLDARLHQRAHHRPLPETRRAVHAQKADAVHQRRLIEQLYRERQRSLGLKQTLAQAQQNAAQYAAATAQYQRASQAQLARINDLEQRLQNQADIQRDEDQRLARIRPAINADLQRDRQLQADLAAANQQIQGQAAQLRVAETALAEANNKSEQRRQGIAALQNQLGQLQRVLNRADQEIQALRAELAHTQAGSDGKTQQIDALRAQIADLERARLATNQELAAHIHDLEIAQEALLATAQERDQLRNQIAELREQQGAAQNRLAELERAQQAATAEQEDRARHIANLEAENAALAAARAASATNLQNTTRDLTAANEDLTRQITALREQSARDQAQLTELGQGSQVLRIELANLREKIRAQTQLINRYEEEIATENADLKTIIQSDAVTHAQSEAKIADLNAQLRTAYFDKEAAEAKIAGLEARIRESEAAQAALNASVAQKNQLIEALIKELDHVQAVSNFERQEAQDQLDIRDRLQEELRRLNANLVEELNAARAQLLALQSIQASTQSTEESSAAASAGTSALGSTPQIDDASQQVQKQVRTQLLIILKALEQDPRLYNTDYYQKLFVLTKNAGLSDREVDKLLELINLLSIKDYNTPQAATPSPDELIQDGMSTLTEDDDTSPAAIINLLNIRLHQRLFTLLDEAKIRAQVAIVRIEELEEQNQDLIQRTQALTEDAQAAQARAAALEASHAASIKRYEEEFQALQSSHQKEMTSLQAQLTAAQQNSTQLTELLHLTEELLEQHEATIQALRTQQNEAETQATELNHLLEIEQSKSQRLEHEFKVTMQESIDENKNFEKEKEGLIEKLINLQAQMAKLTKEIEAQNQIAQQASHEKENAEADKIRLLKTLQQRETEIARLQAAIVTSSEKEERDTRERLGLKQEVNALVQELEQAHKQGAIIAQTQSNLADVLDQALLAQIPIERLQKEIDKLNDSIRQKDEEIAQAKRETEEARAEQARLREKSEADTREIAKLTNTIAQTQEIATQSTQKAQILTAENTQLQASLREAQDRIAQLETENADMQRSHAEAQARNKEQIALLSQKMILTTQEIQRLTEVSSKTVAEVEASRTALTAAQTKASELQTALRSSTQQAQELQATLDAQKLESFAALAAAQEELAQSQARITALEGQIRESEDAQIIASTTERKALQAQFAQLQESHRRKLIAVEAALKGATIQRTALQTQFAQSQARIRELDAAQTASTAEREALQSIHQAEMTSLEDELKAEKQRSAKLTVLLRTALKKVTDQTAEFENLTTQQQTSEARVEELTGQLALAQYKSQELEQELRLAKEAAQAAKAETQTLRTALTAAQTNASELETALLSSTQKAQELQATWNDQQLASNAALASAQEELAQTQARITALEALLQKETERAAQASTHDDDISSEADSTDQEPSTALPESDGAAAHRTYIIMDARQTIDESTQTDLAASTVATTTAASTSQPREPMPVAAQASAPVAAAQVPVLPLVIHATDPTPDAVQTIVNDARNDIGTITAIHFSDSSYYTAALQNLTINIALLQLNKNKLDYFSIDKRLHETGHSALMHKDQAIENLRFALPKTETNLFKRKDRTIEASLKDRKDKTIEESLTQPIRVHKQSIDSDRKEFRNYPDQFQTSFKELYDSVSTLPALIQSLKTSTGNPELITATTKKLLETIDYRHVKALMSFKCLTAQMLNLYKNAENAQRKSKVATERALRAASAARLAAAATAANLKKIAADERKSAGKAAIAAKAAAAAAEAANDTRFDEPIYNKHNKIYYKSQLMAALRATGKLQAFETNEGIINRIREAQKTVQDPAVAAGQQAAINEALNRLNDLEAEAVPTIIEHPDIKALRENFLNLLPKNWTEVRDYKHYWEQVDNSIFNIITNLKDFLITAASKITVNVREPQSSPNKKGSNKIKYLFPKLALDAQLARNVQLVRTAAARTTIGLCI